MKNPYDKFAVCRQTNVPGKLCLVTVGHAPKEMSCHIWYALKKRVVFSATVKSVLPKCSPLKQGGLEIIITIQAKWQNSRAMDVLERHVEKILFPEYGEYSDDSLKILKEIMKYSQEDSENEESESESEESASETNEQKLINFKEK